MAHAYLLVGPPHSGKMTLAVNLAQALNCEAAERPCGQCLPCQKIALGNHPDVPVIGLTRNAAEARSRTEISIDQIREMQHTASLPPFEGKYKVFIIDGAELMSTEAANCLLKTLEEPAEKVVFILLTTNDNLLLPTVVSRCQRLELTPLPAPEIEAALTGRWGADPEKARLLARLAHGCPGWAILATRDDSLVAQRNEKLERILQVISADSEAHFEYATQLAAQFTQDRESVQDVLDLWQDWWRDLLLAKLGHNDIIINRDYLARLIEMAESLKLSQIRAFIHSLQAAGAQLRLNANPRLVLEVMMLDMPGKEGRSGAKSAAPAVIKYG